MPGGFSHLEEDRPGPSYRPGGARGLAVQQEEPRTRRLGPTPGREHRQRPFAVPRRLLRREERERPLGGARGATDGALRVVGAGHGLAEVMGERGKMWFEVRSVQALDRLGRLAMEAQPLGRSQLLVERVADQRVRESVAAGRARHRNEQPGGDGGGEAVEKLPGRQGRETGEDRQLEVDTQQRREPQGLPHLGGERRAATADRLAYALGHWQPARR
ncbi:MAG TPA: hypothetical protein VKW76_04925 [Candidatus Binatia bacterium]|nr:hypothetical protein [Candidatus Binatia bacterium]